MSVTTLFMVFLPNWNWFPRTPPGERANFDWRNLHAIDVPVLLILNGIPAHQATNWVFVCRKIAAKGIWARMASRQTAPVRPIRVNVSRIQHMLGRAYCT
jgi:hypothetical protein